MTSDTPFHLQRVLLEHSRHSIYLAMASRTAYTFSNVNAVVEICEFRKVMDPLPLYRLIIPEAGTNGLKVRAVRPYLTVAIHTCLGRRQTGRRSCLNSLVTISAINAVIADMVFMTELNRLLPLQIASGNV